MTDIIRKKIENKEYTIKNHLTFEEYVDFVRNVYQNVINEENGTYSIEAKIIALGLAYIGFYTDINWKELSNDDTYQLSELIETIRNNARESTLLEKTIDDRINFGIQKIINKPSASDELILRFAGFLDKGATLLETLTNMASSMSPEELKGALSNLKDIDLSKFTSKDIIDAVFSKHAKKPKKNKSGSIDS